VVSLGINVSGIMESGVASCGEDRQSEDLTPRSSILSMNEVFETLVGGIAA
jgi:hypothetical protein